MRKLNWNYVVVKRVRKTKRILTSFNLNVPYISANFKMGTIGMVMSMRKSKLKSVNSTFTLTSPMGKTRFFINLSRYLTGSSKFKVLGSTFLKVIKSAKLSRNKLNKMRYFKEKWSV